jgi:hypothetical protein
VADGSVVSGGGIDGSDYAYSAKLIGSSLTWQGSTFSLGSAGKFNAVSNMTIPLTGGSYSSLKLLATAVNGNQANQEFIVTYSDGTQSSFIQSMSDWGSPQNYAGESTVLNMAYRISPNGTAGPGSWNLYGYSFALNSAKSVERITLPANRDVVVLAVTLGQGTSANSGNSGVPAAAAAVGYNTVTFNSVAYDKSHWYPVSFYGAQQTYPGTCTYENTPHPATAAAAIKAGLGPQGAVIQNSDGSLTIEGTPCSTGSTNIATAFQTSTGNDWVGTAFGGGMYAEAELSFQNSADVADYAVNGGPSFWMLDVEHSSVGPYNVNWPANSSVKPWSPTTNYPNGALASLNNQTWISTVNASCTRNLGNSPPPPGTQGNACWEVYNDFFEVDIMEWDFLNGYQFGIGNWFGNNPTQSTSNPTSEACCVGGLLVPQGTNPGQPHKYGALWVPATGSGQTTQTQGYLQAYFDSVPIGPKFYWNYHDPSAAGYPAMPPVNESTAMSGMDWRHMFLMLGTETQHPMNVNSVTVWQKSGANNWVVP